MRKLLALLALVALCGCQALSVDDLLSQAEQQIISAPDSALVTVKSIKRYALINPKHRARYGVVYSAALDKNYIDVTADSLIRYSASYYDLHGTPEERMRAYYYLGRVYENAKDYQQALLYYLDAAQYTESVEDNYLKGLLYSRLGQMYEKYYNYEKAYVYSLGSHNYFKAIESPHHIFQLYQTARALRGLDRSDKCIEILTQAIKESEKTDCKLIKKYSMCELFSIYNYIEDYESSYKTILECEHCFGEEIYNTSNTCGAAANTFAIKGQYRKAERLLKMGWILAKDATDSLCMQYCTARYLIATQHYKEGKSAYNQALCKHVEIVSQSVNNSIASAQSKYFTQKAVAQKNRADRERIAYSAILIIIIIIIVIIAVSVHTKEQREIHKKESLINQYLDVVKALQIELDDRNSRLRKISDETLRDRCTTINQLCRTYFETTQSKRQQTIIFNEVKTLVENLSSDAYLETVEKCVNQYCDNLLVQLKQDMPELSHNEYKLACFVCIGFSTQVMCLVFDCNPEALYRRVYRLRDKIRHCPSEHKAKYLKYI